MNQSVEVSGLSKKFELGVLSQDNQLRERIVRALRTPFARNKKKSDVLWALRDVSFDIAQGEVVGFVGRNGAGKSTLLKILSRITYPTSGSVRIAGRVASLLEVGTGFHEELTGRENIFLNGSILGMRSSEVARKLDAIVEFSGVERFLDTPIKRYSSGMRLRLGFAVAAHLDPDVLIVDEVLAVGDAGFQKKCINAMEDLRGGGRTVLFVSHNMAAVENLCTRGIWIDGGKVREDGPAHSVIKSYLNSFDSAANADGSIVATEGRRGSGEATFTKVEFLSIEGGVQNVTRSGDGLVVRLHYKAVEPILQASLGIRITTDMGTLVTETSTSHHGIYVPTLPVGDGYVDLEISHLNLLPSRYFITLGLTCGINNHVCDWVENAVHIDIETGNIYNSTMAIDAKSGIVYFPQRWRLKGIPGSELM